MSRPTRAQLAELSQTELDAYIDRLVQAGDDDSAEFHAAYREWERREQAERDASGFRNRRLLDS